MNIKRVEINGVGPLRQADLRFQAPGLNVVLGENESGKSTLCAAMVAILYGFSARARETMKSWNGTDQYSGLLELEIGGDEYIVERDFADDHTRLIRIADGEEEMLFEGDANPRGRTEMPKLYQKLLRETLSLPPEAVMASSAYVGQIDIPIDLSHELRRQISGAGQADYKKALTELREDYYALTSKAIPGTSDQDRRQPRRIEQLRESLGDIQDEFMESSQVSERMALARESLGKASQELESKQAEHRAAEEEINSLKQYLNDCQRLQDMESQEKALRSQSEAVTKQQATVESLQEQLNEKSYARLADLDQETYDRLKQYVHAEPEKVLQEIEAHRTRENTAREQMAEKRFAVFAEAPENTDELLDDLQGLRTKVQNLEGQASQMAAKAEPQRKPMKLWLLPAILGGVGLLLGALIGVQAGQSQPNIGAILGALGGALTCCLPMAALGLIIAAIINSRAQGMEKSAIEVQARLADARHVLDETEAQLEPVLAAAGDDISIEVLRERWDSLIGLEEQADAYAAERQALEKQDWLAAREDAALKPILEKESSGQLRERIGRYESLTTQQQAARNTLDQLKEDESGGADEIRKLERNRKDLRAELKGIEERYPAFETYGEDRDAGLQHQQDLNEEIQKLEATIAELSETERGAEKELASLGAVSHREPVQIEEEIEFIKQQVERSLMRRNALARAHGALSQSIAEYEEEHMARLSEATSDYFQGLTAKSHPGLQIDQSGDLLILREGGESFDSSLLSVGATDQLYLALRMAVLDLLAEDVPLPLILDDSFVNFDARRLKEAKKIIRRLAKQRQILLLTHDRRFADWSENVIEINPG